VKWDRVVLCVWFASTLDSLFIHVDEYNSTYGTRGTTKVGRCFIYTVTIRPAIALPRASSRCVGTRACTASDVLTGVVTVGATYVATDAAPVEDA
jgi:hypothetical protein